MGWRESVAAIPEQACPLTHLLVSDLADSRPKAGVLICLSTMLEYPQMTTEAKKGWLVWVLVAVGFLALGGALAYGYNEYTKLEAELAMARQDIATLSDELEASEGENANLTQDVAEQQAIIDNFSGQISRITNTVGTLEKLAATDPELLKKYSRVYFLNENYVPAKLGQVEQEYAFSNSGGNFLINADVWPFLKRLLDAARADGQELLIASAFRSFDTQGALNASYRVTYGSGANQFSAEQGYSEHQLGTAVDFTTPTAGAVFARFANDPAYQWLLDNAHRYGFVLSYPEGNTYYKYEPWHWRFVGRELAIHLKNEGKYFYDLDQREIDAYLVKLFD